MDVDRDAAAIVRDGDGFVRMNGHDHAVAIAGEGFVDRVIHHLEHHVVQAATIVRIADVHSRTLTNGVESS